MELREYLEIIKKRLLIIILITFLTTAVAVVVSFFVLPDIYQAGTTLYAGKLVDAKEAMVYTELLAGQILVKDYREIAKSRSIAQEVKASLSRENINNPELQQILSKPDADLSKLISVDLKNDTRIIEIKVQNTSPEVCAIIANKIAEVFQNKAMELMKVENVQIVDKAEVPKKPIKPNKRMNTAIGFVVGLMGSLGIVFLIEYLDNTIKTPEDVAKYTELTVIGAIPKYELLQGNGK